MSSILLSYVRAHRAVSTFACLLAVILVGASLPAEAALVQITQTSNQITADSGNTLNADVTGDGNFDVTFSDELVNPSILREAEININGVLFQAFALDPQAGYMIDGVVTTVLDGIVGETYFMPITFTDIGFSPISVDAILEIRVQANSDTGLVDQVGVVLRRVLFDLDLHGPPTGYSEFVSYPEAQRIVVPEPASGALLISAMGLVWGRWGRRGV